MRIFAKAGFLLKVAIATAALGYPSESAAQREDNVDPAVVVVDREILEMADLTFENTIRNILRGDRDARDVGQGEMVRFIETLLETFAPADQSSTPMEARIKPSPALAGLDPKDLLGIGNGRIEHALKPSAVFYRPDLAPEDFEDCGEFRIVYSFAKPVASGSHSAADEKEVVNRFFLIFETRPRFPYKLVSSGKNLDPTVACQKIAGDWMNFRALSKTAKKGEIAEDLNAFFYKTMHEDGSEPFERAMRAEYLGKDVGNPLGQVRGNFLTSKTSGGKKVELWQLREWILALEPGNNSRLFFKSVTTDLSPRPAQFTNDASSKKNQQFRDDFTAVYAQQLKSPEIYGIPNNTKCSDFFPSRDGRYDSKYLINGLGLKKIAEEYLTIQDISSTEIAAGLFDDDDYNFSAFRNLAKSLTQNKDNEWKKLLRRLQALSCSGCHEHTVWKIIGTDKKDETIKWPRSSKFVHIEELSGMEENDETTRLSSALKQKFLPFRSCALDGIVAGTPRPEPIEKSTDAIDTEISKLRSEILSAEKEARTLERDVEFGRKIILLRKKILSKPGAFVKSRRTH
jgi:hypothetical protein